MKSSSKKATNGQVTSAIIAIAVIIGATAFAWYWMENKSTLQQETQTQELSQGEPTPIPTPTPTPTKLIHGKDTYSVGGGGSTGPSISEVSFDPLDPAIGGTQIITVKISDTSPVTSAQVNVRTDTKTTPVKLTRISGTDLGGIWEGRWVIPESYLYNYIPTVVATSDRGETSIPITIRERK